MATILEYLKGLTAYPVPRRTIESLAMGRGLIIEDEATPERLTSKEYRLTLADLYSWLVTAPNISQGGQSYSLSSDERKTLANKAASIYYLFEDNSQTGQVKYGYKGSKL